MLSEDPLEAVRRWPGITLQLRSDAEPFGKCSVAGSYFEDRGLITVARSASKGRQKFTALHELGHHLQRHDESLVKILASEPDAGFLLEEDICDGFAAEVLLPTHYVDEVIGERGPTAGEIVELFKTSQASREACCVRGAQHIVGPGHVMLSSQDGVARFTASSSAYRVARNTPQDGNEVISSAVRWGSAKRETRVRYASGVLSEPFHGDAVTDGDYIFAVMAIKPAWKSFTMLSGDPRPIFPEED